MSRDYAACVFKILGKKRAKELLNQSLNNFQFNTTTTKEGPSTRNDVYGYFVFLGEKIVVANFSVYNQASDISYLLSKEMYISGIKNSPAYKYIMGEL